MYNNVYRPFDGYEYRGAGRYGFRNCECGEWNAYWHPPKIRRRQERMDVVLIDRHTDKFVSAGCEFINCKDVPVKREEKVKSLVLDVVLDCNCLKPGTFYTMDTDHPIPDDYFADPIFIRPVKCDLVRNPVKLIETETVYPAFGCGKLEDGFDGLPDGDGGERGEGCGCAIPANPGLPNQDFIPLLPFNGLFREKGLIPVELDLLGDQAFADQITWGNGRTIHPKTLQLWYTNRGTFTLCRGICRKTDY